MCKAYCESMWTCPLSPSKSARDRERERRGWVCQSLSPMQNRMRTLNWCPASPMPPAYYSIQVRSQRIAFASDLAKASSLPRKKNAPREQFNKIEKYVLCPTQTHTPKNADMIASLRVRTRSARSSAQKRTISFLVILFDLHLRGIRATHTKNMYTHMKCTHYAYITGVSRWAFASTADIAATATARRCLRQAGWQAQATIEIARRRLSRLPIREVGLVWNVYILPQTRDMPHTRFCGVPADRRSVLSVPKQQQVC